MPYMYSAARADRQRRTNELLRQRVEEGQRAETRRKSTEELYQRARGKGLRGMEREMTEGAISFEQLREIKKAFSEMDEFGQKRFKKSTEALRGVAELLLQKDFELEKSGMGEQERQATMQELYNETMSNLIDRGLIDPNDISEQYDRYEMGLNLKNADRIRKGVYGTEIRHTGAGRGTRGLVTWKDAWKAVKDEWRATGGSLPEVERFIDEVIPFKYRKRARRLIQREQRTEKRPKPVF